MTQPGTTGTAPEPAGNDPLGLGPDAGAERDREESERHAQDEQAKRDGQLRRDDGQPPVAGHTDPKR
ncbi:hypothetical protein AB0M43_05000 [Longispora sp. NPDC051575]|uniref:hypothetical protein n=1 Tax=Longispora sp. NPDC051575 TaxID=3154943 RepID=UPI00341305B9